MPSLSLPCLVLLVLPRPVRSSKEAKELVIFHQLQKAIEPVQSIKFFQFFNSTAACQGTSAKKKKVLVKLGLNTAK